MVNLKNLASSITMAAMLYVISLTATITVTTSATAADCSNPQSKLMARRAARLDAIRNLTETVYGTRIDSKTTVRNFVTEVDTIRTNLEACIRGASEIDSRYYEDCSAEVTMEIEVGMVTDILGTTIQYNGKTFRATGFGAPSGEPKHDTPQTTTNPVPSWANQTVRATGSGAEPDDPNMSIAQKKAMGFRAAEVEAKRNLLEQVMGVKVTSDTYVRDYVTRDDRIRAEVEGFLKGANVVDKRVTTEGIYEVDVEIELSPLQGIIK